MIILVLRALSTLNKRTIFECNQQLEKKIAVHEQGIVHDTIDAPELTVSSLFLAIIYSKSSLSAIPALGNHHFSSDSQTMSSMNHISQQSASTLYPLLPRSVVHLLNSVEIQDTRHRKQESEAANRKQSRLPGRFTGFIVGYSRPGTISYDHERVLQGCRCYSDSVRRKRKGFLRPPHHFSYF
jgi:hypothetical protein